MARQLSFSTKSNTPGFNMEQAHIFQGARIGEYRWVRGMDAPIGDPYSGPAFEEKLKSKGLGMVIGVVASVMTMGAAMPMLASGVLASQIAGGAMMAGGVLTGVGTITGNKKLTKIGGVLSLAGGIGGAVANMAGAGSASATGALSAGSGSTAVQNMAGNFMESVNSLGIGEIYNPELISSAQSAGEAGSSALADTASQVAAEGAGKIGIAGEAMPAASEAGGTTLELAKSELAAASPAGYGDAPMAGTWKDSAAGSTIKPAGSESSGAGFGGRSRVTDVNQYTPPASSEKGIIGKTLDFMNENKEVTKIGASMLENAMKSAAEDESVQLLNEKYKAEANLITTQNDLQQYKLNNMQQQVAMISANDPDLDAKVKAAAAKGIPVAFVPAIGAGYTPYSKNFKPQVNPATYGQTGATANQSTQGA